MKFTEHSIDLSFDSALTAFKGIAILSLTAPYRLVTEISSKVIFLGKKNIQKIIATAVVMASLLTVAMFIGNKFMGVTSILAGRFPIVLMLVGIGILVCMYVAFSAFNFVIYDQFNQLFQKTLPAIEDTEEVTEQDSVPEDVDLSMFVVNDQDAADEKVSAEPVTEVSSEAAPEAVPEITPESKEAEIPVTELNAEQPVNTVEQDNSNDLNSLIDAVFDNMSAQPEVSEETKQVMSQINEIKKAHDSGYVDLVTTLKNNVRTYNGFMDADQVLELNDAMEDSTDPSKYISEELITAFVNDIESLATHGLEDLDLAVIPSTFTCTK